MLKNTEEREELGYTVDEMHEIFLSLYAPFTYKELFGKKIVVKIRTSEMETIQFTEYVESIRIKMAELNIIIPDPKKYD